MESKLIFMFQRLPIEVRRLVLEKIELLLKVTNSVSIDEVYEHEIVHTSEYTPHSQATFH